jgi:MFS family permease
MLFINMSVIMVYSLNALYLSTVVGLSSFWIGMLEGAIEATSFIVKLCSGVLSDYFKRRKSIMLVGYALTALSKPLLYISSGYGAIFASRIIERVGNGIQGTPRDALVGDVAPSEHRGACYGLQRSLGLLGSIFGAILAIIAMSYTTDNFRTVFLIATIPATIALIILYAAVKEPKHAHYATDITVNKVERHPIHFKDMRRLGKEFWCLMIVVAIFMFARVTETFIVIDAHKNFGLPKSYASIIMFTYNITYCLCSFPIGLLADRFGRYRLLILGIAAFMLADIFIGMARNLTTLMIGVLFWGCQMGISQNIFASLVADLAPDDIRGTGFGFLYLISGLAVFIGGIIWGGVAVVYDVDFVFIMSFVMAGLSLLALLYFKPGQRKQ